jgi:hypothetical protein
MTEVKIKISDKNKILIEQNPEIINELLSDYNELKQDKITKQMMENNAYDNFLNKKLKMAL